MVTHLAATQTTSVRIRDSPFIMSQEKWADDEVEYLRENYSDTPAPLIAEELDRTEDSIYYKASRLDIKTTERNLSSGDSVKGEAIICSNCGDEYKYTQSGGTTKYCRSCYERLRRKNRKERLISEVFSGECEICEYDDCISALSFHHNNPDDKNFQISSDGLLKKWDDIVSEADKCTLLCSNCHSEHHCSSCDQKI